MQSCLAWAGLAQSKSGAAGDHAGDPPTDLSPTTDFMLLGLNWSNKLAYSQICYFVPEPFYNCSSNIKNYLETKKFVPEQKIVIRPYAMV